MEEPRAKGKTVYFRWALFAANFLFWGFGVAAISVGIWIMVSNHDASVLTYNLFRSGTVLVIVGGCVITALGFLGWLGAYKENIGVLSIFIATMFVVCILEMAGGIWAAAHRPLLVEHLQDNLYNAIIVNYGNPRKAAISRAFDNIQHNLHCCGVNNYTDWAYSRWRFGKNFQPFPVPTSCCLPTEYVDGCGEDTRVRNVTHPANGIYTNGCLTPLLENMAQHNAVITGIGVTVGVLQIFGLILAGLLIYDYNDDNRVTPRIQSTLEEQGIVVETVKKDNIARTIANEKDSYNGNNHNVRGVPTEQTTSANPITNETVNQNADKQPINYTQTTDTAGNSSKIEKKDMQQTTDNDPNFAQLEHKPLLPNQHDPN